MRFINSCIRGDGNYALADFADDADFYLKDYFPRKF